MKAPTWKDIRELYESVLELPLAERALRLRERAGGSAALVREVERLLANTLADRDYLRPPSGQRLDAGGALDALPRAGARIGSYVLRELIGAGGMGTVFLAQQERPSRSVALKFLRAGFATADAVRRFELEAEVLGRLRHPGIAAIYELGRGTSAQGEGGPAAPFLAMEYIEGARDIVSWARQERAPIRKRIEVFRDVCAAVQHAHRSGVIHRDLKPGNVLIDGNGRAKVIDFGIARVLAPDADGNVPTLSNQAFGTLQYASPEQISRDWREVDVRTDVYSLGALLFELLAQRPYIDTNGRSIAELVRDVCEIAPPPPSRFAPQLPRELDWIVAKCLAKDREERYGTVEELAADLTRFLGDEPVVAGPPSAFYRLRKFVARNRLAVGAAMLVFLSLVAGLLATSLALKEAKREHTRAESALLGETAEAARANLALRRQTGVVDTLKRILGAVAPGEDGRKVTVYELLERERPRLDREFPDDPGSRAALEAVLGGAYDSLGLRAESDELLTSAVATLEKLGEIDPVELAWLRLMLAKIRTGQSRFAEAQALFDASLHVLEAQGKLRSATGIKAVRLQASLLARSGRTVEALDAFRKVAALAEEVLGANDPDTIMAMSQVAAQSSALRKRDEAEDWARRAQARAEGAFDPGHPLILFTAIELGQALQAHGKISEAVPVLRDVLAGSIEVYTERHPNTIRATEVLAGALKDAGEFDEAEQLARGALETALTQQATVLDIELWARICLADVLTARLESSAAAEQLSTALARLEAANMPRHPAHFRLRWALAELDLAAGRMEGSELLVRREAVLASKDPDSNVKNLILARGLYGRALWAQGRKEEAKPELSACLDAVAAWTDPELAALTDEQLDSLQDVCAKLGREDQRKRLEILESGVG